MTSSSSLLELQTDRNSRDWLVQHQSHHTKPTPREASKKRKQAGMHRSVWIVDTRHDIIYCKRAWSNGAYHERRTLSCNTHLPLRCYHRESTTNSHKRKNCHTELQLAVLYLQQREEEEKRLTKEALGVWSVHDRATDGSLTMKDSRW